MRGRGIEVDETNYAKQPLPPATIEAIVKAAGGVAAVMNTRHEVAKAGGWADKPPSVAEFVKAAAKEPNLLRRPIFIRGKQVLIGYDKKNEADWTRL